ncbi:unnamed protein product [Euphydryas editha]|uniref:C2 domain-containing protein n=1 Tax=Euphydryas editha TaxID=104508 RepID=A0AAU9UIC1_EUPED|nr:unnamed protein product [Euphydryas editha]
MSKDNRNEKKNIKTVAINFNEHIETEEFENASLEGIGAILKQTQLDGKDKTVAYFSKKLNESQKRKKAIYLECFAIKEAVKYWQHWLIGKKFTIYSDHKPLENMNIKCRTDEELGDLTYYLSQYDFTVKYIPGKENVEADCLSRNPVLEPEDNKEELLKIVNLIQIKDIVEDQEKNENIIEKKHNLIHKNKIYYKKIKKYEKIILSEEFSKKFIKKQGVGVELVRALDSHPPNISNVFCECDSKDDVTITCDCEATPAFQLKAFSQRGEKVEVSHYRVNVNRFRARLHVVCITDKLTGELKCDGWPDVKVALAAVGPLRPNAAESDLQQLISDIVVSALRNTHLQFNFSSYPTCPRLRRYLADAAPRLPLHYDAMLQQDRQMYTSTPNSTAGCIQLLGDKRLLVKVVEAKDLGGKSGCVAPYCVVEMDEPPQRNQTGFKKDTNNPQWDEHFLFDLSPQTAELLFEVYDRTGPPSPGNTTSQHRFLGLGLVGIDELLAAPSQRQQIGLQTRPMEEHDVSGSLTVEFLFIEGADIPDLGSKPFKIKESLRTVTPQGRLTTTTKTTFQQNGHDTSQLTESALRELELSPTSAANKSTLIIHSVQRVRALN